VPAAFLFAPSALGVKRLADRNILQAHQASAFLPECLFFLFRAQENSCLKTIHLLPQHSIST
jgi:hypothetical protein